LEIKCPICGHVFDTRSKTGHTNCGNCLSKIIFNQTLYKQYRQKYLNKPEQKEKSRIRARIYYQKNRERIREKQKEYHRLHAKEICEKVKKWRLENLEKYREWRLKNKEIIMAKRKEKYRQIKEEKMRLFGGKCEICGYNKCLDALVFHHKDPNVKEKEKDWLSPTFNKENYMLICANCHAEIHQKMREELSRNYKENSMLASTLANSKTIV
jgi:predicted HNH restriction endonuclease